MNRTFKIGLISIIFVVFVFLFVGIFYNKIVTTYDSFKYLKSTSVIKDNSIDPFYEIDNLVKNKYIVKIDSTSTKINSSLDNSSDIIAIRDDKVYVGNDLTLGDDEIELILAEGITGTPLYVKYLSYQSPSNCMFVVLTKEGDLFTAGVDIKKSGDDFSLIVNKFKLVNSDKIINIYTNYFDQKITYPFEPLTIYAETSTHELLTVHDGEITSTFNKDFVLPDQICSSFGDQDGCMGLYFSFDRHLYLIKDKDKKKYKEILYKKKSINVLDAFSITNISSNDEEVILDNIIYYIIDKDYYLYKVVEDKDYNIVSVNRFDKKVKDYKFLDDDSSNMKVNIAFSNGDKNNFNDVSVFSSLYYRYNKK